MWVCGWMGVGKDECVEFVMEGGWVGGGVGGWVEIQANIKKNENSKIKLAGAKWLPRAIYRIRGFR